MNSSDIHNYRVQIQVKDDTNYGTFSSPPILGAVSFPLIYISRFISEHRGNCVGVEISWENWEKITVLPLNPGLKLKKMRQSPFLSSYSPLTLSHFFLWYKSILRFQRIWHEFKFSGASPLRDQAERRPVPHRRRERPLNRVTYPLETDSSTSRRTVGLLIRSDSPL